MKKTISFVLILIMLTAFSVTAYANSYYQINTSQGGMATTMVGLSLTVLGEEETLDIPPYEGDGTNYVYGKDSGGRIYRIFGSNVGSSVAGEECVVLYESKEILGGVDGEVYANLHNCSFFEGGNMMAITSAGNAYAPESGGKSILGNLSSGVIVIVLAAGMIFLCMAILIIVLLVKLSKKKKSMMDIEE